MAFVLDQNDPSGLGMFSKPGRFTAEKYVVFQRKDEILSNERKVLRVNALSAIQFVKNVSLSQLSGLRQKKEKRFR